MKLAGRQVAYVVTITSILLFPFRAVCEGTNRSRTFDNYAHGFRITLPDNWELMPAERLADLNDNAAKANPTWRRPALHYGYQQKDSPDFVFPPFLWIRIMELDHEPTSEFSRAELTRDKGQEPGVETGEPVFDSGLEALVAEGGMNLEGQVPMKTAVAFFSARKSLIKVFCFAARSDAESHPQLLRQMFAGVRIYDDNKTRGAKRSPTGLVVSLIAIGVLALVVWKSKPIKAHSAESPPPPTAS